MKNLLYICLSVFIFLACQQENKQATSSRTYTNWQGKTMGTGYQVQFFDPDQQVNKYQIDSLLNHLDKGSLSTYSPNSTISQFNQDSSLQFCLDKNTDVHFIFNVLLSKIISENTQGAYDPTVMPLVNYWGFGYMERKKSQKDSTQVEQLMSLVGIQKVDTMTTDEQFCLLKKSPKTQLDFSAIAKGYACDQVALMLRQFGIQDFYIEVGGELLLSGKNASGTNWVIGVNTPNMDSKKSDIFARLQLSDVAVASSGNYRNYYQQDGKIISHTINPKSGFPIRNEILSATILSPNAAEADAYATAAMVMGWKKFLQLANESIDIDCYLIYSNDQGQMLDTLSEGARKYLLP